jgi:hypothetical protein
MPHALVPPRQMTRTCREEETIDSDRVAEDFSRENNKKNAAKPEKAFLGKEKHVFRGDSALENKG